MKHPYTVHFQYTQILNLYLKKECNFFHWLKAGFRTPHKTKLLFFLLFKRTREIMKKPKLVTPRITTPEMRALVTEFILNEGFCG